jgi:hypothetical protein
MRILTFLRLKRGSRHSRNPTAIPFTMGDFDEMQDYVRVLSPYGVSWRVDAMDSVCPEIAIIYRSSVPIFQLWRSTAGLCLRGLDRDFGMIVLPDQNRIWCLICCLATPPIWLDKRPEAPVSDCRLRMNR